MNSPDFLALIWASIIGLILALYVLLDGFDLGIGLLTLFTRNRAERSVMMSGIGPVWGANETWLVLAGAMLFGAFPRIYGVVLNALYLPVLLMLFGLIFRAVSFEFRGHSDRKPLWEFVFGAGSLAAIAGQGFILGGLLGGLRVADGVFAGGPWDWLTPFTGLVAVALAVGDAVLGAAYLLARAPQGALRERMRRLTFAGAGLMLAALIGIGIAIAFLRPDRHGPQALSLAAEAADSRTLLFMLGGLGPLIPVMLAYNVYLYRVFRGPIGGGPEPGEITY
jgi:cytochrome bd ubiquinol oxidase subunit II